MEILSTGEKIKRARIYKGLTLKELCGDKISVSKMSCIENNKIEPENWILDFISEKLDLDIDYLQENVKEQLMKNIESLEKHKDQIQYDEKLNYNLAYAIKFNYFDLGIKFMHLLFNYYINNNNIDSLTELSAKYYDLFQKAYSEQNQIIYHIDIARYFYINEEYLQATTYYENVRKSLSNKKKTKEEYKNLIIATYNEVACYVMLKDYKKAFEVSFDLINLIDYIEDDLRRAETYHLIAVLSLRMEESKFEIYENKCYEFYKENTLHKAYAVHNFADAMFELGYNDRALTYILKGLEIFPKENKRELVEYMLNCLDTLLKNKFLDEAEKICDEVLNYAIELDYIKFIERSYYYRAIILQERENYISAEMYMNLSLDSLVKFGTKQDLYKRYLEMGNMYFKLNNVTEAIKFFSLALKFEKKM